MFHSAAFQVFASIQIYGLCKIFLFLKPACSLRLMSSTVVANLSSRIRLKTLLVSDRSVTPLQLSQVDRSPRFGSFTIRPDFHSSGASSFYQMLLNIGHNTLQISIPPPLSISAVISSSPGVLPDFIFLMD